VRRLLGSTLGARRTAQFAAVAAVGLLAALGASPAMAAPKGEYAVFSDCPVSNPALSGCIFAKTESGEFKVGTETVPIVKTQVLQGGFIEEESGALKFVAAADGNTLPKTPQAVPGGLLGLVKCNEIKEFIERIACELVFQNGVTGVNATVELAAPASSIFLNEENLLTATGTALTLPVKVHLENPFLGSTCYIGSNSNPLKIELTTGTTKPPLPNKPITGKVGTLTTRAEGGILVDKGNSLVNNTFSAPGATGCGGPIIELLLDPIINSKLGLPSAAGHNTAILNGTLEQSGAEPARESE
jgi:hypothetical protein